MKTLLRIFSYFRRYPLLAMGTLACAVVMTLMVIVFPKVTQLAIDDISEGKGDRLTFLTLLALGAFFIQNLANTLRIQLNNHFEQRVIFDLRGDLYAHIQRLPLPWFDNRSTGDVMTRLMEDVQAMERVLIDGIEQGVVAVLQMVIVAAMCFYYSPMLAGLALLPVPFLAVGASWFTFTAHRRYRLQRTAASSMNSSFMITSRESARSAPTCARKRNSGASTPFPRSSRRPRSR